MNWFYKQSERELGRGSVGMLHELADCGVISNTTLVRETDRTDWIASH